MSQFYNITGYQQGGDPWSNEHGTFQTFWVDIEGVEGGVMLNKKVGSTPAIGQIYGDLISAVSQSSGNQYWKFKSQKKPPGITAPAAPAGAPQPAQPANPAPAPQPPAQQPQQQPGVNMSAVQPDWFKPWGNMITYIYNEMKKMETPPSLDLGTVEPTAPPIEPPAAPAPAPTQPALPLNGEPTTVPPDVFSQPPAAPTNPDAPAPPIEDVQ